MSHSANDVFPLRLRLLLNGPWSSPDMGATRYPVHSTGTSSRPQSSGSTAAKQAPPLLREAGAPAEVHARHTEAEALHTPRVRELQIRPGLQARLMRQENLECDSPANANQQWLQPFDTVDRQINLHPIHGRKGGPCQVGFPGWGSPSRVPTHSPGFPAMKLARAYQQNIAYLDLMDKGELTSNAPKRLTSTWDFCGG